MKLTRCPICHNEINLEVLVEDNSGRELLMLVSNLSYGCAKPMIAYIGLFRTQKSNLSNSRAVNLINEVLQFFQPSRHLAHALRETVNNIHAKRLTSEYKTFKNHNYSIRSSNEEYFEQMYRAGIDFNKLEKNIPGALDWYKKKTEA
ncbi:hypothetical protein GQ597_10875 [Gilliamella sp. Pra-s65]|uniref:hypothetical protein n=1 Tax=unclassified Gilliamella TaxID=2685620 RepID=UPI001366013B|nr:MULTISPECIES: hypothetical protein [unclassified Gilliamella]MWN91206.1 hypothetical protein [Gilliamella sp. Pra-s65]MWP74186.1 hypothetical protein [Gilliamella sp. Pra-s52]